MSYTIKNFPRKKALREALKNGELIGCVNPGLGPNLSQFTGTVFLEGPHYPQPHSWYGKGQMKDGQLVSIK